MSSIVDYKTLPQIPKNSFVFRYKGTSNYVHFLQDDFLLINKMCGCLVVTQKTALNLIPLFKRMNQFIEMIEFDFAYVEHGQTEMASKWNNQLNFN